MNPYWSAMVAAYVFDIRVVVITRTTSPKKAIIEENHSPEPEQRPNTVENNDTQEESTKIDHLKEKKAEPEKQTVTEEDDVTPKLPMKVNHVNEKKNKRKETEANITDELEYHYATRVFEFKENFKNEIDTFVPVTEKKGCYRLTDNHFNAKKPLSYCISPDTWTEVQRVLPMTIIFCFFVEYFVRIWQQESMLILLN